MIQPDGHVSWGNGRLVINPWDEYAVEEALRLKERGAEDVTVLGMGTQDTEVALKHALAMGVDDAVLVSDHALRDADTLLVSHALAQAIKKMDDTGLVIFGRLDTHGAASQTGVQVARHLGWHSLTFVSKIVAIDFLKKTIGVERSIEGGIQTTSARLPAVISVVKSINDPRYPSYVGMRKAARKEISVWSGRDIDLDPVVTSKVEWVEITTPPTRENEVFIIEGDSAKEKACKLIDILLEEKVITR